MSKDNNITKNWFYKLSEFNSKNVTIEDNIVVAIFDDIYSSPDKGRLGGVLKEINIEIWENSIVEFYSVLENTNYKINFLQDKTNSKLTVRYFLLSKDNCEIKSKIFSELKANNTKSDIHITSIIWNDWFVDLDWIIKIDEKIEKADAKLIEENLFLWNTWKVKWVPTLLVRSNDVKASHACRIERISDEKLFYLRSRWIWKENALNMMVESYISNLFKCLAMINDWFYKETFENILKKIK